MTYHRHNKRECLQGHVVEILVEEHADRVGAVEERGGDTVKDLFTLVVSVTQAVLLYVIVSNRYTQDTYAYIPCSGSYLVLAERRALGCVGSPPETLQTCGTCTLPELLVASALSLSLRASLDY